MTHCNGISLANHWERKNNQHTCSHTSQSTSLHKLASKRLYLLECINASDGSFHALPSQIIANYLVFRPMWVWRVLCYCLSVCGIFLKKRRDSALARNARKLWSPTFKQTRLIPAGLKADAGKKGMDAAWQQLRDKQNRRNSDWPWNLIRQRSGLRSEFHIFWRENTQTRIFKI